GSPPPQKIARLGPRSPHPARTAVSRTKVRANWLAFCSSLGQEVFVEPIVGIFSARSPAENAAHLLRGRGFTEDQISMLLPGESPQAVEAEAPTEEAEQSGVCE